MADISDDIFDKDTQSDSIFDDKPQSMSGPFMDYLWSNTGAPAGRILNSIGQGASDAWGGTLEHLKPAENVLKNTQLWDSHKDLVTNLSKAYTEITRASVFNAMLEEGEYHAIAPFASVFGAGGGALTGLASELEHRAEAGKYLVQEKDRLVPSPAAAIEAQFGQFLGAVGSGQYFGLGTPGAGTLPYVGPLFKLPASLAESPKISTVMEDTSKARAEGKLGEGEEGFFNTEPVSEENIKLRTEASREANLPEPPVIKPPVTDVETIARGIDPELFQQKDSLTELYEKRKAQIEELYNKEIDTPEYLESEKKVDQVLSKFSGVKITNANRAEIANQAFDFLDADHPHIKELNEALVPFDAARDSAMKNVSVTIENLRAEMVGLREQIENLGPQVAFARSTAEGLLPDIREAHQSQWYKEASKYTDRLLQNETPAEYPNKLNLDVISGRAHEQELQDLDTQVVKSQPKRPISGPIKPVEGTGDKKVRGLSQSVEARAIKDNLVESLSDLPEYSSVSWSDQADKVSELYNKDYDRAYEIAMGNKRPPKDVLASAVFRVVEDEARKAGDWETVYKLATQSKIPEQITTMAQNLGYLGYKAEKLSMVNAVRSVQKAREAAMKRQKDFQKAIQSVADQMREYTKKSTLMSKEDWGKFFDEIKCAD